VNKSCMMIAALVACAGSAMAQLHTGPTSSATPYLVPVNGAPEVNVYSILTTGDSVNTNADGSPYRMVGIPDGLGAYDNGDGTMTVLMNHELTTAMGVKRLHQQGTTESKGSFVSQWVVSTTPGASFLGATHGQDLATRYVTSSNGTGGGRNTFNRFCSADLADQSAYFNPATGKGTTERFFMSGEENGAGGRLLAHAVSERVGYQLTAFDSLGGAWENALARPYASDTTLVMANSDGGLNRVFAYVGTKQETGSSVEKAGLTNGTGYGVQVQVNGVNVASENRLFGFNTSGTTKLDGTFTLTQGASGTSFLRPEDGAWNPANPREYFFVTTDQHEQTTGGNTTTTGRSRLWKMTYSDVNNPLAGGTIEALLDGTEGQSMFDNICCIPGTDGHTRFLMQEDVGNNTHNGKVWLYDATTDVLTMVLQHDPARFGDVNTAPTTPFNIDEESSGVIDARDTLGLGWFLLDVQAHYTISGELAEGGQLLAIYLPSAIPAPAAPALLGAGCLMLAGRRRRN
jgi:hypothetical protein